MDVQICSDMHCSYSVMWYVQHINCIVTHRSCILWRQKVGVTPGLHLWKVPTFHPRGQWVTSCKIKRFHELRVEKQSWVQSFWSFATFCKSWWRCSSKCLATNTLDKFLTQAWLHPSWLGLEQCPSQFHYIPRPGNRANKLIRLGAPFKSYLPACSFSQSRNLRRGIALYGSLISTRSLLFI